MIPFLLRVQDGTLLESAIGTTDGDRSNRPLRRLNMLRGGRSFLPTAVVQHSIISSDGTRPQEKTACAC